MRVSYKANTTLGIWSVRLLVVFFLFLLIFYALVASGQRGGDTFFSNPVLTVPILIAGLSAVGAFFTGIICIVRNRERAVSVFLSTAIGFFVLLYGLAEIIFPH